MKLAQCTVLVVGLCLVTHIARGDEIDRAVFSRCPLEPALEPVAGEALTQREALDGESLRALAEQRGVPAPSVRAWVARGTPSETGRLVANWLARQGAMAAWSRCGLARDGTVTAVVMVPRLADVGALATHAALGSLAAVSVELPTGARSPTLVVMHPDGTVTRDATPQLHVRFAARGAYTLQLMADTEQGPLAFATWHVRVGSVAADEEPDEIAPPDSARELIAAINRTRLAVGAAPVRADPLLAEVASQRALQLAASGTVAHALDPSDSPVARLARARIAADRVAENVARSRSIGDANARFDASPSHHANRIDPALDALGVGIAVLGEAVYVVELYATHPRIAADPVEPAAANAREN